MPFKQGRAKTGGRAKGSSNKTTKDIREVAAIILSNEMEGLENRLERFGLYQSYWNADESGSSSTETN